MNVERGVETGILPDNGHIAAVHQLLRIPDAPIANPSVAPPILFLDKFWQVIPTDLTLSRTRETYIGFDSVPGEGFQCTEVTRGEQACVEPKDPTHLVTFHTEPYFNLKQLNKFIFAIPVFSYPEKAIFAQNLPSPHYQDILSLLIGPAYAEVIFHFGPTKKDFIAAIVIMKTQSWKPKDMLTLWFDLLQEIRRTPTRPFRYHATQDAFVSEHLGLAVYRGFMSLPPTAEEPLRLRGIA